MITSNNANSIFVNNSSESKLNGSSSFIVANENKKSAQIIVDDNENSKLNGFEYIFKNDAIYSFDLKAKNINHKLCKSSSSSSNTNSSYVDTSSSKVNNYSEAASNSCRNTPAKQLANLDGNNKTATCFVGTAKRKRSSLFNLFSFRNNNNNNSNSSVVVEATNNMDASSLKSQNSKISLKRNDSTSSSTVKRQPDEATSLRNLFFKQHEPKANSDLKHKSSFSKKHQQPKTHNGNLTESAILTSLQQQQQQQQSSSIKVRPHSVAVPNSSTSRAYSCKPSPVSVEKSSSDFSSSSSSNRTTPRASYCSRMSNPKVSSPHSRNSIAYIDAETSICSNHSLNNSSSIQQQQQHQQQNHQPIRSKIFSIPLNASFINQMPITSYYFYQQHHHQSPHLILKYNAATNQHQQQQQQQQPLIFDYLNEDCECFMSNLSESCKCSKQTASPSELLLLNGSKQQHNNQNSDFEYLNQIEICTASVDTTYSSTIENIMSVENNLVSKKKSDAASSSSSPSCSSPSSSFSVHSRSNQSSSRRLRKRGNKQSNRKQTTTTTTTCREEDNSKVS